MEAIYTTQVKLWFIIKYSVDSAFNMNTKNRSITLLFREFKKKNNERKSTNMTCGEWDSGRSSLCVHLSVSYDKRTPMSQLSGGENGEE